MSLSSRINNYLLAVAGLPETVESGSAWLSAGTDQSMRNFTVAPLSLRQILFNTNLKDRGQLEAALKAEGIEYSFLRKVYAPEDTAQTITEIDLLQLPDGNITGKLPELDSYVTGRITVRSLFKLSLMSECIEHYRNSGTVMKVEDAVFGIKNALSVADDFMPQEIMQMVEGRFPSDPGRILGELQLDENYHTYVLMKESSDGFIGFHSIIPGFRAENSKDAFSSFLLRLSGELKGLESSALYADLRLSRILKSLIFQMEFKKQRELGRSLLSSDTLELLRSENIIDETGEKPEIRQTLNAAIMKRMKSEVDSRIGEAVKAWHTETLQM